MDEGSLSPEIASSLRDALEIQGVSNTLGQQSVGSDMAALSSRLDTLTQTREQRLQSLEQGSFSRPGSAIAQAFIGAIPLLAGLAVGGPEGLSAAGAGITAGQNAFIKQKEKQDSFDLKSLLLRDKLDEDRQRAIRTQLSNLENKVASGSLPVQKTFTELSKQKLRQKGEDIGEGASDTRKFEFNVIQKRLEGSGKALSETTTKVTNALVLSDKIKQGIAALAAEIPDTKERKAFLNSKFGTFVATTKELLSPGSSDRALVINDQIERYQNLIVEITGKASNREERAQAKRRLGFDAFTSLGNLGKLLVNQDSNATRKLKAETFSLRLAFKDSPKELRPIIDSVLPEDAAKSIEIYRQRDMELSRKLLEKGISQEGQVRIDNVLSIAQDDESSPEQLLNALVNSQPEIKKLGSDRNQLFFANRKSAELFKEALLLARDRGILLDLGF